MAAVAIKKTLRSTLPRIPFEELASAVLPRDYELSLVICGDHLARTINKTYRNKTYAANVLSFPLRPKEGEIFLNARQSAREAKRYGVSPRARLALLFVHGLHHLKGLRHGRTMEQSEKRLLRAFDLI